MKPSPESEKIENLRQLLSLVVENTKREMQGKRGQADKEAKLIERHVQCLLGRAANPAELALAKRF